MKNNKQQTAIEWLIEKQLDAGIGLPKEWREQAKEMEKQQIIDAWIVENNELQRLSAEQYYNKKYGAKK